MNVKLLSNKKSRLRYNKIHFGNKHIKDRHTFYEKRARMGLGWAKRDVFDKVFKLPVSEVS